MSSDEDRLLEHEYDGIREYDNPLPGWWRAIFYGSIVFAIGYWIWFHMGGPGRSELQQFAEARAVHEAKIAAEAASRGRVSEETLARLQSDPATIERGRGVFLKYCQSCHTENGRGLVGPNLTDDFQRHGTTRSDLFQTVLEGEPNTAMVAWGPTLQSDELIAVVAFVSSLRNTNVPDGKEPYGERVAAFAP
jgi:cytochrome c oxidase cbb3-type subunit 3